MPEDKKKLHPILQKKRDILKKHWKENPPLVMHTSEEMDAVIQSAVTAGLSDADEKSLDGVQIGIAGPHGFRSQYSYEAGAEVFHSTGGHYKTIQFGRQSVRKGLNQNENDPTQDSRQLTEIDGDNFDADEVLQPPFNFKVLQGLLISSTMHSSSVDTKAADYAYSGWELKVTKETEDKIADGDLTKDEVNKSKKEVERFLLTCADGQPIEDLCRDLAIEYESLGMCGFEFIRNKSGLVGGIKAIRFSNVRILSGKSDAYMNGARYVQLRFNKKVYFTDLDDNISYAKSDFNPMSSPIEDFPLEKDRRSFVTWDTQLIDAETAQKGASKDKAASELFVLARRPFTLSDVYGSPAGFTAMSAMLALRKIEEYNLQFFESKGVPQYAVIIKGLKKQRKATVARGGTAGTRDMDDIAKITAAISEFFTDRIKRADRSVLVMQMFGEAEVVFEKLSSDKAEASFSEYEERMIETIRLAHRIPPAALGINEESANIGSGRDTTQMRRYRDHIISPGQRQFAFLVNKIIRHGMLVPYFRFEFDPISLDEETDIREIYLDSYRSGAITIDELRERIPGEFGPDELDMGNTRLFPPGSVLVGQDIEIVAQGAQQQQAKSDAYMQKHVDFLISQGIVSTKGSENVSTQKT